VNQLAVYLDAAADAQAAPGKLFEPNYQSILSINCFVGVREELKKASRALENQARQLIDEANNILASPEDEQAKERLARVIRDINDIIDNSKMPLKVRRVLFMI